MSIDRRFFSRLAIFLSVTDKQTNFPYSRLKIEYSPKAKYFFKKVVKLGIEKCTTFWRQPTNIQQTILQN